MTPQVLRSFGEKRGKVSHLIQYELRIRGWNQAAVARALGYSGVAVGKVINGQGHSEVVLAKLREIGVPEEYLFDPRRAGVSMRGFGRAKKQLVV